MLQKWCLIQQKEGQKWISHVIFYIKMSENLFYFFECYTVLSTKLHWTKTTSYTSILGTYYPFFLFCISIFFVLPNNFIVLGFVILAYINFYFEHQSIINSIDVNMNMRNYCYLLFNNILDIILNIWNIIKTIWQFKFIISCWSYYF